MFYNAYVKPHFDYCNTVWSNTSSGNINKISKLQRRGCKLILAQDYTDIQEAMERLNILSSDQIIFLNNPKLMNKFYKKIFVIYIFLSICHIKYIIQFTTYTFVTQSNNIHA